MIWGHANAHSALVEEFFDELCKPFGMGQHEQMSATVGQLVIAIATLGQQVQKIAGSFQQQASNLLQSDQKTKLPPLQLALELHPAALQAVSLGLLNAP